MRIVWKIRYVALATWHLRVWCPGLFWSWAGAWVDDDSWMEHLEEISPREAFFEDMRNA